jgi:hypothetical protein
MIQKLIESFTPPVYQRVTRGDDSYAQTNEFVYSELERLVKMHSKETRLQTRRLIRDSIDHHLRRHHGYSIKGSIGTHYMQVGLEENGIFEHMIPNSTIRDMLLADVITPAQACNMPTCRISKHNDNLLRKAGYVSNTPDIYNFWKRYAVCEGDFVDNQGKTVYKDMTLEDHFRKFNI